jgi:hypothetical protein
MREFYRGIFWVGVNKKLDDLKLDPELREELELEILKTVPRPANEWALWAVTCVPRYDV